MRTGVLASILAIGLIPASLAIAQEHPIYSFKGWPTDGAEPWAAVVVDQSGKLGPPGDLNGTTLYGGVSAMNGGNNCGAVTDNAGCGTVFQLTPPMPTAMRDI
jgi:hypothetical protein